MSVKPVLEWTFTQNANQHPLVLVGDGTNRAAVLLYRYNYSHGSRGLNDPSKRFRVYFPHNVSFFPNVARIQRDFEIKNGDLEAAADAAIAYAIACVSEAMVFL